VFLPQCFISLKHGLMYRGVNVWLISIFFHHREILYSFIIMCKLQHRIFYEAKAFIIYSILPFVKRELF